MCLYEACTNLVLGHRLVLLLAQPYSSRDGVPVVDGLRICVERMYCQGRVTL